MNIFKISSFHFTAFYITRQNELDYAYKEI